MHPALSQQMQAARTQDLTALAARQSRNAIPVAPRRRRRLSLRRRGPVPGLRPAV
jgi:hypothetical protein